ncbi:serine/threonine-protein phosphatase 4 regulatory subunit 2-A-like isoform X3 [Acanthochromis polyacanthus]|uniref:Protein phosphatase 4, regulatory subunit 2a n=1 Tax=Acanthochromis polyacanthus TaxID=80966 RepID=A0A3Q1G4R6_9TELE|nr:serine/threonine-protein phosphatase 4 regulatory subunit 2-A-like isoform X3 [Acanthochromis polyacanthus]
MDIDALLEAFQDFEKKGKRETCPVLEQFLCHVAKTGQPMILWSQFKTYFMFKLEKVMDDFHASTPEQRGLHNPNVEYVPFEEMKKRILKIVDGYNGIPFTIQRLCELLTDPKRNYTGTDKFLRGLEKNVMVVSCVYPSSDRNVNGPGTPKPLTRPKLSLSTSLSTNGLPDSPISREPEPTTEEVKEHCISESSLSESAVIPNSGIKNKHPEEEEDSDADKQEVKRLKFDEKEEEEEEETSEEKESSCHQGSESLSETPESSKDSCGEEYKSGTSCEQPGISDDHDPSSTQTEPSEGEGNSSEAEAAHSPKDDSAVDQSEQPASSEKSTSFEQDSGENSSSSSSSSDGEGLTSDKQVPSSSNSPDLSTEGGADISNGAETVEPEEQD